MNDCRNKKSLINAFSYRAGAVQGLKIDGAKYFQTRKIVVNVLTSLKIFGLNGEISQKLTVHLYPLHHPYAAPAEISVTYLIIK